jgi:phosphoenolpyruvate phosphomutase
MEILMKKKVVYLGLSGDIIHPGIVNMINEGAKHGQLLVGLLTDSAFASHKRIPF